ncbi:hypothetical protein BJ742DRAFT_817080 [Cladochytrium replicatum]|nr:hypothetical protein BJ742DRAFT_817080 [Cladochytrium replicatum]
MIQLQHQNSNSRPAWSALHLPLEIVDRILTILGLTDGYLKFAYNIATHLRRTHVQRTLLSSQYRWIPTTAGQRQLGRLGLVQYGTDIANEPLYVCTVQYLDGVHPGKVGDHIRYGHFPYHERELLEDDFFVLSLPKGVCAWIPCSDGNIPDFAVPAGREARGDSLYAARAKWSRGRYQLGKVGTHLKTAHISFGGNVRKFPEYEVLAFKETYGWMAALDRPPVRPPLDR